MTTMGVTVFCNRVQINDQERLTLLRTLRDSENNIAAPNRNTINTTTPSYEPTRLKKHGRNGQPPPVAVARRNARERNRVKQVNNGFATLRQHIPSHVAAGYGDRGKKLSKVETLRMAVEYIRGLQRLLAEADGIEYEPGVAPSPASSIVSSSHNASGERVDEEIFEEDDDYNSSRRTRSSPELTVLHSPNDFYASPSTLGDEENLEPSTTPLPSATIVNRTRSSSSTECYMQNEENLSPYGRRDGEEQLLYATEAFSGAMYCKEEPGEFMDVVSWWEQEQQQTQQSALQQRTARLAHV